MKNKWFDDLTKFLVRLVSCLLVAGLIYDETGHIILALAVGFCLFICITLLMWASFVMNEFSEIYKSMKMMAESDTKETKTVRKMFNMVKDLSSTVHELKTKEKSSKPRSWD